MVKNGLRTLVVYYSILNGQRLLRVSERQLGIKVNFEAGKQVGLGMKNIVSKVYVKVVKIDSKTKMRDSPVRTKVRLDFEGV